MSTNLELGPKRPSSNHLNGRCKVRTNVDIGNGVSRSRIFSANTLPEALAKAREFERRHVESRRSS
jgi:hypothetical protein